MIKQAAIDAEIRRHGDIVQYNFTDIYQNIRLKAVSMLHWASSYCHTASYVIRTDDDVITNVTDIVAAIRRVGQNHSNFILGDVKVGWGVQRSTESKYFVPMEEYSNSTWPNFALGGMLGYPLKTVELLYQASLTVPAVWLDDVYITALCRREINATLLTDDHFTFTHGDMTPRTNLFSIIFSLIKTGSNILYNRFH